MVFKVHIESYESIKYIVGRNAYSNWKILNDAENDDIWIHLHNDSSPYVILENTTEITEEHIKYGAELCKQFSNNNKSKTTISYLPVQYVCKGKTVGEARLLKPPSIKSFHF